MVRRPITIAAVVILALALSSCRTEDNTIPPVETQDRIIQTATLLDDPTMLQLTWDPVECETFKGVSFSLLERQVRLRIEVTVDIENCPPGGFSQTVVDLGEPLGDREVFDRAFEDTVALENDLE